VVTDCVVGFLPAGAGYLDADDRRKVLQVLQNPCNTDIDTA
jgi:hypothetical protein